MGMQEPKVLTFDVVGTLIDFEGGVLDLSAAECSADAVDG